jgi:NDP-sugar pyrophosphorylase family protein
MMQAVVLAGGLATRLGPRTAHTPKSMLEVAGRPFIAWQLDRIAGSGIEHVILCIGHLGREIAEFVGDGSRFGLDVAYSDEGESLLGTAGALRFALPLLDHAFVVTYGDSFLPFDYSAPLRDLIGHGEALGTMSVFRNAGRWDASNVGLSGERVGVYAKGVSDPALDHIDYGATALRRRVIESLPPSTPIGLDRVQADLAARGLLRAHVATERFYEIGSPAGLTELDHALRSGSLAG